MSSIRIALSRLRRLHGELIPENSLKAMRQLSTVVQQTVDAANDGEKEMFTKEQTMPEDVEKIPVKATLLSKQQLTNYILNHVLYEDDNLLAFNKPNGLPIFVNPNQVPGPALIYLDKDGVAKNCKSLPNSDSYEISIGNSRHSNKHSKMHVPVSQESSLSLFDILPDLQHHVNSSVLEIGMPLSRLYSGVVVLTKTPEARKKLKKYLEMTRSQKINFQTFKCVTVGIPSPQKPGPEEMVCRRAQIDNQTLTEPATNVSVNLCKNGDVMRFMMDSELVDSNTHLNCSVIDLKPTKDKWDAVEWYLTRRLCCALGDHVYSARVGCVLGVPTHIEPHIALPKTQVLPKNIQDRLRLKESQVSNLPLHIHRHSVELRGIPFKRSKPITISAPLPDFFLTSLRQLRLTHHKVDCGTRPCEQQKKDENAV